MNALSLYLCWLNLYTHTLRCCSCILGGFFEWDDWLLDNVDKIRHIPTVSSQPPSFSPFSLHHLLEEAAFLLSIIALTQGATSKFHYQSSFFRTLPRWFALYSWLPPDVLLLR